MRRRSVQRNHDRDHGHDHDRGEKPKRADSLAANYWWEPV
jgi:hypothetical protein